MCTSERSSIKDDSALSNMSDSKLSFDDGKSNIPKTLAFDLRLSIRY